VFFNLLVTLRFLRTVVIVMEVVEEFKCPYCNSINIVLNSNGEYVCTVCGTVLDTMYMSPVVKESVNNVKTETPRPEFKMLTRVLRRYETIFSPRNNRVLSELRRACTLLGISDYVQHVKDVYMMLSARLRRNFTHYQIAACAVYYVVKRFNLPVDVKSIIRVFRMLGHDVNFNVFVRFGAILKMHVSQFERTLTYINYALSKLNLSDEVKVRVVRHVKVILRKIPRRIIISKSPKTVAGALILLAAKDLGINIAVKSITKALSVHYNQVTDIYMKIRRNLSKLDRKRK